MLTFQTKDGGFAWYPGREADPTLTAYALRFLSDAKKFIGVDAEVLAKTRENLVKLGPGGVKDTAERLIALLDAGTPTNELVAFAGFLKSQKVADVYLMALVARALAKYDAADGAVAELLNRLEDAPLTDAATVAQIALAFQAAKDPRASRAVRRLAEIEWGPSGVTTAAIEAISTAASGFAGELTVAVDVNGHTTEIEVKGEILHTIDLTPLAKTGKNTIRLKPSRENPFVVAIEARWWEGWDRPAPETPLTVESTMTRGTRTWVVSGKVRCSKKTSMILVEIPLPPGFVAQSVNVPGADRTEVFDGRLVLYYPAGDREFQVSLEAHQDVKATARPVVAYDYYDPAVRGEAAPGTVDVARW